MGVLGPIQHHKAAQGEATVCDGNAVNVTKQSPDTRRNIALSVIKRLLVLPLGISIVPVNTVLLAARIGDVVSLLTR